MSLYDVRALKSVEWSVPRSLFCGVLLFLLSEIKNKNMSLVVGAVLSEPVSGLFSLLTGKKQGKFTIFG